MNKVLMVWALTLLVAGGAPMAQDFLATGADRVSVDTRLSVDRLPVGETADAAVVLDIEDGWHVQAAEPTFETFLERRSVTILSGQ